MAPLNGHTPKAVLVSNTGVDENVHLKTSLLRFPILNSSDQDKVPCDSFFMWEASYARGFSVAGRAAANPVFAAQISPMLCLFRGHESLPNQL